MNDSIFDPQSFLDAMTTDASVRRPPLPAGVELPAVITDLASASWQSKDGSKSGYKFDLKLTVDIPPELVAQGQPPQLVMNDSIMLDVTASGAIDYAPGKNARLRRYRDATGLNTGGEAFSPRMLLGRQVRVKIKHDTYEGELYDRIDSVAKL